MKICPPPLLEGVFFMSVEHELSHLVELHDGMNSQVRQVLEELAKDVEGRVETGYGLTDGVAMEKGLGQGRRTAPDRSKLVLAKIQHALNKVVAGVRVWGGKRIPQCWFADDGLFMCNDFCMLQLAMDVCWWFS